MKRFVIAIFISLSFIGRSQEAKKAVDPKYIFCYKETSFETDDYKIYIEDAVNVDGFSKFKFRIFNKTNDYLIFKPTDLIFKIGKNELVSKDKQLIILPNEEGWKVIDVKGKGLQEEKYVLELKTMYKISVSSPSIKLEDLNVPVTQTEFTAGSFKCEIKKADAKTDKTIVKCLCTYNGDMMGVLSPNKIVAIMPKGQENANINRNKGAVLEKGKSDDFVVEIKEMKGGGDMQKQAFKIKWNDTFRESKLEPVSGGKINMEFDIAKTAEKNR